MMVISSKIFQKLNLDFQTWIKCGIDELYKPTLRFEFIVFQVVLSNQFPNILNAAFLNFDYYHCNRYHYLFLLFLVDILENICNFFLYVSLKLQKKKTTTTTILSKAIIYLCQTSIIVANILFRIIWTTIAAAATASATITKPYQDPNNCYYCSVVVSLPQTQYFLYIF